MNPPDFNQMFTAIAGAAKRFPNCRIGNCDCNSKAGDWKTGCVCMCHFRSMTDLYGEDWSLESFSQQSALANPAKEKTGYRLGIGTKGPSIICLSCGMQSYNLNDIENRYCGKCHKFHEQNT